MLHANSKKPPGLLAQKRHLSYQIPLKRGPTGFMMVLRVCVCVCVCVICYISALLSFSGQDVNVYLKMYPYLSQTLNFMANRKEKSIFFFFTEP